jgi:hypothetical protein
MDAVRGNDPSEVQSSIVRGSDGDGSIFQFILALALAIIGALGAIYVLFFAAGGYFITDPPRPIAVKRRIRLAAFARPLMAPEDLFKSAFEPMTVGTSKLSVVN